MKQTWLVAGVLVVIALGIFFFRTKNIPQTNNSSDQKQSTTPQPVPNPAPVEANGNSLTGILRSSTSKQRGNLMLELTDSDRIIYLNSSRDWSTFLNKEVVVTYDGTLENFSLVNIEAK